MVIVKHTAMTDLVIKLGNGGRHIWLELRSLHAYSKTNREEKEAGIKTTICFRLHMKSGGPKSAYTAVAGFYLSCINPSRLYPPHQTD